MAYRPVVRCDVSRRTGYASLPLHTGKAPAWLFARMVRLSREILTHLVAETAPGKCCAGCRIRSGFRHLAVCWGSTGIRAA